MDPIHRLASKPSTDPRRSAEHAPPVGASKPVRADRYQPWTERGHRVKDADAATYRKVFGAAGAGVGAFAGHFALAGAGIWAGVALAGALTAGPVGAAVGGVLGAAAAGGLQAKTWVGRKLAGRLGALVGDLTGRLAHRTHVPLPSTEIETTRNYSYKGMTRLLGNIGFNSHARIDRAMAQEFVDRLEPGDIVLTNNESSTPFALATLLLTGHCDFTHGIVYTGDNKAVEARASQGVATVDLPAVLTTKQHAVAVRPHYRPGEAAAVVKAAHRMLGDPYDFKFKMGNNAYYCSEVCYDALKQGAPELKFRTRTPLHTSPIVVPADLLQTPDADVVAEAGVGHTPFDAYLAKFTP